MGSTTVKNTLTLTPLIGLEHFSRSLGSGQLMFAVSDNHVAHSPHQLPQTMGYHQRKTLLPVIQLG